MGSGAPPRGVTRLRGRAFPPVRCERSGPLGVKEFYAPGSARTKRLIWTFVLVACILGAAGSYFLSQGAVKNA